MIELNKFEMTEINGGSEYSYELGKKVGVGLRKALVVIGIIAIIVR